MPQIYLGLLDYRKGCGPESCQGRSRRAVLYILDRIPIHSLKAHPSRPKYIPVPERACKKDENDIKLGQENLCQILYLSIKGELQPIYSDSKLTQPGVKSLIDNSPHLHYNMVTLKFLLRKPGLVLVSTGVQKFGKPSADRGCVINMENLNINADEQLAYAA